jgi:outer membrane protein TolC
MKRKLTALAGLATFGFVCGWLILVSGCAVGPDYQPPKPSAPSQWSSALTGGETNSPAGLTAWWKNFNDTNLESLMVVAISSNLNLRLAEARVREARGERPVAVRRRFGRLFPESLG